MQQSPFRDELEKYICGIVQGERHKLLAIYCMPDHTHLFIGLNPAQAISELVRQIKLNTSALIKGKKWIRGLFSWQEGYGAFSHARSQLDTVVQYIVNQPAYHAKRTFREEYLDMLQRAGIDYNDAYVFEWVDLDEQVSE